MPKVLRAEMMQTTHRTYMGIELCLERMREVMYWPGMAAEVNHNVQSCDTCIRYQRAPAKESLKPHAVPDMPWVEIAVDLCQFDSRT